MRDRLAKLQRARCEPSMDVRFFLGFLKIVDPTKDELALILGHEISHVIHGHQEEAAGVQQVQCGGPRAPLVHFSHKSLGNVSRVKDLKLVDSSLSGAGPPVLPTAADGFHRSDGLPAMAGHSNCS